MAAFKRVVVVTEVHINGADFNSMLLSIPHNLRGSIEAHRLGVEQRSREGRWMIVLDPGRHINELREGSGMTFRKAIGPKAPDLLEASLGEVALVAAANHAFDHVRLKCMNCSDVSECRHGASKLVCFLR